MGLILSGWAVFFAICYGLGRAIWKALHIDALDEFRGILTVWVGWGALVLFLQIWHLAFKVDSRAFAIVAVVAAISLLLDWRNILRDVYHLIRHRTLLCLAIAGVSVVFANQAMRPLYDYDTGLYHLQAIRWMQDYPIIKGLGNLHGRFAFNNANFLYVALVSVGPWRGAELNIANSLLIMVATAQALTGLDCAVRQRRNWKLKHVFAALMIFPVVDSALLRGTISSPSSDVASAMVQLSLMVVLLHFLQRKDYSGAQAFHELGLIVFLAALGIAIKLSSGVFSAAAVLLSVSVWLAHHWHVPRRVVSGLTGLGLIGGVVLVPWMARGVVLSGYPLYPSTVLAAPVSWCVPAASAESEARWIYSWARWPSHHPDEVLSSWDWLDPWLETQRDIPTAYLPALMAVAAALLVALRFATDRHALARPGLAWAFLLPATVAVGAWFFSAPNPRFAVPSLYGTAIGACLLAVSSFQRSTRTLLAVFLVAAPLGWHLLKEASPHLVHAGPERGLHPVNSIELRTYETESGLTLYCPASGDRCFDAPLPCTPYPNPRLRLRGDSFLSGFEIGGTAE